MIVKTESLLEPRCTSDVYRFVEAYEKAVESKGKIIHKDFRQLSPHEQMNVMACIKLLRAGYKV